MNRLTLKNRALKIANSRLKAKNVVLSRESVDLINGDCDLIEEHCRDTLDSVLDEDSSGMLKDIWKNRKIFVEATIDSWNRTTVNQKKGARFNPLIIRIALCVYSRSTSAYRLLKQLKILPLPSEDTLKSYVRTYSTGTGLESYQDVLKLFIKRFDDFIKTHSISDPIKEVWTIFDEIKLCCGITWNCRDDKVIGYQMSRESMAELTDIYNQGPEQLNDTEYALVFLIRSAVYPFQMLGPHFTSDTPMKGEFVKACLVETVISFYYAGFDPTLSTCDGGSPNLACIKSIIDVDKSAFRQIQGEDLDPVCTDFAGIPGLNHHFMICPPHQLKNMINALESSQSTGKKDFMFDETESINYKFIYQAYYRDLDRIKAGAIRQIQMLTSDAIQRNQCAWRKRLNTNLKIFISTSPAGELCSIKRLT
eukprot:Lithocolla_globosa_v1_NODE_1875_length_2281_cov_5.733603.p1 type:complete len:422 gc:universal NODE_1875_length_2281_cov_5.733603:1579-314(-)